MGLPIFLFLIGDTPLSYQEYGVGSSTGKRYFCVFSNRRIPGKRIFSIL